MTTIDAGDGSTGITDADVPFAPNTNLQHPGAAYSDGVIYAASYAAYSVVDYLGEYREIPDAVAERCDVFSLGEKTDAINAIADFIRKLGRDRATPAVVAQQMKILGHWDDGETDPVEDLVIGIFSHTLTEIDAFEKAEAARIEARMAEKPEPYKVPIDETSMEAVDDAMATW